MKFAHRTMAGGFGIVGLDGRLKAPSSNHGKRPVETVVGNGQFRDAGGGTGMTDCGVGSRRERRLLIEAEGVPTFFALPMTAAALLID